jgi:Anti-sigma-K factor rskA/Putative zinc-finger
VSGRGDDGLDHERLREDLAGYALGALTEPEAERLEAHLGECEQCLAELRWLGSGVDVIAAGVEPRRPPRRLRRRLLATVRAEASEGGRRWAGWTTGARPALAAAAVAVVLVAGAVGYALRDGGGSDAVTVAAEATELAPAGAEAELVRADGAAMLAVSGLPRLEGGDVYQAWVRVGEAIEPSSTFVLDHSGEGVAAIPEPLDGADEVMVTREPRGGSERPSTRPLLRAPLS